MIKKMQLNKVVASTGSHHKDKAVCYDLHITNYVSK